MQLFQAVRATEYVHYKKRPQPAPNIGPRSQHRRPIMNAPLGKAMARNTHALFAHASRNSTRAIVPINDCALESVAPRPAFYCVHSASGVAGTDFLDLAQRLEPTIRFYGIQAPPKQMPDTEFGNSVDSIAEYYAEALSKFQPTGPLLIGGYCVGAVIALAMIDKLRARGREVGPLLAIDGVPENVGAAMSRWRAQYWIELARNVRGWFNHGDLMRSRTLRSLVWSIANNATAIGKGAMASSAGRNWAAVTRSRESWTYRAIHRSTNPSSIDCSRHCSHTRLRAIRAMWWSMRRR